MSAWRYASSISPRMLASSGGMPSSMAASHSSPMWKSRRTWQTASLRSSISAVNTEVSTTQ